MSRMQLFAAQADLELRMLAEADHFDGGFLGGPRQPSFVRLPHTDEPGLQDALACLLRAEMACDFAEAVADADAAAQTAPPGDAELVAGTAARASARRRAAQRAAAHEAHIVEVIREPIPMAPGTGAAGETAMEVVGYVGVTGRSSPSLPS
ncbi:hypothetical protein ONE63_005971 [Megalurothrips usitatus]|uniref:Uncharacterized protein n=1 Tax=Megalurothrips usitatus TaxID=439358 RepID=A0AAV7XYC5_9NEOP|nr:hypothetical protein ONE63_005971 [Megalurothrips usitatus]